MSTISKEPIPTPQSRSDAFQYKLAGIGASLLLVQPETSEVSYIYVFHSLLNSFTRVCRFQPRRDQSSIPYLENLGQRGMSFSLPGKWEPVWIYWKDGDIEKVLPRLPGT